MKPKQTLTLLTTTITYLLLTTKAKAQIDFDEINPVSGNFTGQNLISRVLGGGDNPTSQPGLLPLAIVLGGLLLLVMLLLGGFTMLTNPTNPEAQAKGKQRITWGITGFVLLFSSYWIIQILELLFGLNIV